MALSGHEHILSNIRSTSSPVQVLLPNNQIMASTHEAYLNIPGLPRSARHVHLFPSMEGTSPLLSIGQLCDHECTATFSANEVCIRHHDRVIIRGVRSPVTRLWYADLASLVAAPPTAPCDSTTTDVAAAAIGGTQIHSLSDARRVAFFHAALGSPALTTLLAALDRNLLVLPTISSAIVRRNSPNPVATAQGHLDQVRQGIQPATAAPDDVVSDATPDEPDSDRFPGDIRIPPAQQQSRVLCRTIPLPSTPTLRQHHDLTGRLPTASTSGKQYLLIMFCEDANYVHAEAMTDRSGPQYVQAYTRAATFFTDHGFRARFERLDNEAPRALVNYCHNEAIQLEYVAPHNHRANRAERAIRTYKNHFIATLCTAHASFPLHAWDTILPQIELTLNLLRASNVNPHISAWTQLCGPYDFNRNPIAPVGTPVLVFERPENRATWSPHGKAGWYVGPALQHYRCYHVFLALTNSTRITDTLSWHPERIELPGSSPVELLTAALSDVTSSLTSLAQSPLPALAASQTPTLRAVVDLLCPQLRALNTLFLPPPPGLSHPSSSSDSEPNTRGEQRVSFPPTTAAGGGGTTSSSSADSPPHNPTHGSQRVTPTSSSSSSSSPPPPPQLPPSSLLSSPPSSPPPPSLRPSADDNRTSSRLASRPRLRYDQLALGRHHSVAAAMDIDTASTPSSYRAAMASPQATHWIQAHEAEFERHFDLWKSFELVTATDPVPTKKPTYYNPQLKVKVKDGVNVYRVRGTAGGDRITYDGDTTALTAHLDTVKALLNAAVSEDAHLSAADIKDFYIAPHHVLPAPEYMYIPLDVIPPRTITKYHLQDHAKNGRILVRMRTAVYGLPQAGRIAQDHLIALLTKNDFIQCPHTPLLFRHAVRPIHFVLVVDDFLIKWKARADLDYLLAVLRTAYPITVDLEAVRYLGMTIRRTTHPRTLSISMPNYIAMALNRFEANDLPTLPTPMPYVAPVYSRASPPRLLPDTAPLVSADRRRRIQQIVGTLLYYARAVDPTLLAAVSRVASRQAHATAEVETDAMRLLQYAKGHPNASIVYHPSDMHLNVHSDASLGGETSARSRVAGYFYLGSQNPHDLNINGHIHCFSAILDVNVTSAAEAEYGALFLTGQDTVALRQTLHDLGYPQSPTTIVCDNSCAVGIANDNVKQRRSKAFDLRFHWIRDRIKQGQISVI